MYFSEVDVEVRQPRPREPIASLTYVVPSPDFLSNVDVSISLITNIFTAHRNIRSSDDISSGYSSGEALQTQRTITQGDSLVRTSSVGARTRAKPRSTTKKTPEVSSDRVAHLKSYELNIRGLCPRKKIAHIVSRCTFG